MEKVILAVFTEIRIVLCTMYQTSNFKQSLAAVIIK